MSEEKTTVQCPFCPSDNVERITSFGTAQLVRQYYCNDCHSVFEHIRWQKQQTSWQKQPANV